MGHTLRIRVAFLLAAAAIVAAAQSVPPATPPTVAPETAFISTSQYTNAFFGFSFPIPQGFPLREFYVPSRDSSHHSLFGLQAQTSGLSAMTVSADHSTTASIEEVKKAAAGPQNGSVKRIEIAGKEFWKSEAQDRSSAGKMRSIGFATALSGFVLQFYIVSFDGKLADALQRSIEAIRFFDPAKALELAGADSRPYNPAMPANPASASIPSSSRIGQLNLGVVSGNTYTNDSLGFTFEFPAGWTVDDKVTEERAKEAGHQFAYGNDAAAAREHEVAQQCSRTLL